MPDAIGMRLDYVFVSGDGPPLRVGSSLVQVDGLQVLSQCFDIIATLDLPNEGRRFMFWKGFQGSNQRTERFWR